jgi:hypothetical protein
MHNQAEINLAVIYSIFGFHERLLFINSPRNFVSLAKVTFYWAAFTLISELYKVSFFQIQKKQI